MYDAAPFVCNMDWFNSLPTEYQEILMEEAKNAREIDLEENDENKYLDLLKEAGMEVNEVDKAAFQNALRILGPGQPPQQKQTYPRRRQRQQRPGGRGKPCYVAGYRLWSKLQKSRLRFKTSFVVRIKHSKPFGPTLIASK